MSTAINTKILHFLAGRIGDFRSEIKESKKELLEIFKAKAPQSQDQLRELSAVSGVFMGRLFEIESFIEQFRDAGPGEMEERPLEKFIETFGADESPEEKEKLQAVFRKFARGKNISLELLSHSVTYLSKGFVGSHPLATLLIAKADNASQLQDRNLVLAKLNKYQALSQKYLDEGILTEEDFDDVCTEIKCRRPPETEATQARIQNLGTLEDIVNLLSAQNEESFLQAVEPIAELSELKATFRTASGREEEMINRIYFHLYHIQNKERPECIDRGDSNWGGNAFQGEGLATPEEKYRAVQRTYVEVLLSLILEASDPDIQRGELEEFAHTLDSRDVPPNVSIINLPKDKAGLEHLERELLTLWTTT